MTNNYTTSYASGKEPLNLAEVFSGFFKSLKKLWFIVVISMVLVGIFGYYNYKKTYVADYETKATFSITAPEYDGKDDTSYTNNSQLASVLSVNFDYLINNEVFYEIIKDDLGIDSIPCRISIGAVPETNILSILVFGADPEMNYKVLQSVLANYGSVAEFVLGDTKLDILEQPTIVDTPNNPYEPVKRTILYVLIGLLIGILPIIIYACFVKTIRNKEDVEKQLNVPFLGQLPGVALNKKGKNLSNCSILNKEVGFRYLEAIRSISSRCAKELDKHHYNVILVTSTMDGEGKSTVALNLAYSLSKSQKKVMLIDGDLRHPSLYRMVDQEINKYKMEDFLEKRIKNSQAITNLEGTRVLLVAPNEPTKSPLEYLNSEKMARLINQGREAVDYVIIDTPPCRGLSDAAVLAKFSDAVLYVVKEDFVKVNKIIDTLQEFSYTKKPILGCVLNGTAGKLNVTYGYGKHYGYGYRKGYGSRYYGKYYGYRVYGGVYGEYGNVTEKEFRNKGRSVSKKIALETTKEQKKNLEEERKLKYMGIAGTEEKDIKSQTDTDEKNYE